MKENKPYTIDGVTFKVDPLTYEAIVQKPAIVEAHQMWINNGELLSIASVSDGIAELGEWPYRVEYLLTQDRYIFAGWLKGTTAQLKWTSVLAQLRWDRLKSATATLRMSLPQLVNEADLHQAVSEVLARSEVRMHEAYTYYTAAKERRNEAKCVKVKTGVVS